MDSTLVNPNPELEGLEIHGMTRGSFLLRGALAAGAVCGLGAVGPFVSQALAAQDTTDADILNFALTLEYLEAAFYKKALTLGLSGDAKTYAKTFGQEENSHVDALTQAVKSLGAKPAAMPQFVFPMTDQKSFLKLAQTLEDTGVSAYNGAGPSIKEQPSAAAPGCGPTGTKERSIQAARPRSAVSFSRRGSAATCAPGYTSRSNSSSVPQRS